MTDTKSAVESVEELRGNVEKVVRGKSEVVKLCCVALIARGHIYIAQPPLYKIKHGKRERYLKDDAELQDHLLKNALDGAVLRLANGQKLDDAALDTLCRSFLGVQESIDRLSRRYAAKLLRRLIYMPTLTPVMLKDKAHMQEFVIELQERLAEDQNGGSRYDVSLGFDTRNNMYEILVTRTEHGNVTHSRIDAEFSSSAEYKAMRSLGERLENLFTAEAVIERAEKTEHVASFDSVLNWLMIEARRGQTIQRYKGLGEMNPDQLWETTMDPATRRLLKVNVDDAVAADEIFTTLMGEQVEPRRDFIEKNALAVANLDI